jgi:ribosomal protein S18 acetylase RimI-like enzyme
MNAMKLKNGGEVSFRRLQKGDEGALRQFNETLNNDSRVSFSPHKYDEETLAKVIQRSESDEDRVYAAFDGERIIAYFFLWWFKTEFPVLGIGIADDFQGQGLGKQIMKHLIADAEKHDRYGVELTTMIENERAATLYEGIGFKRLNQVDNLAGDGRIMKEWHMFYPIKPDTQPPSRTHAPPV